MTTVSTKSGKVIKVVSQEEEKSTLTVSDNEMDKRAVEAVKAAINKAKICKKPIAGYDKEKKLAYVEYANGERKYAKQKTDVLAGPNGSGKSTITTFFDKVGKYTNADDVVATTGICDIMHVYDNTETPKRIIRKHKDELSIYPNEYWSEQDIIELME